MAKPTILEKIKEWKSEENRLQALSIKANLGHPIDQRNAVWDFNVLASNRSHETEDLLIEAEKEIKKLKRKIKQLKANG